MQALSGFIFSVIGDLLNLNSLHDNISAFTVYWADIHTVVIEVLSYVLLHTCKTCTYVHSESHNTLLACSALQKQTILSTSGGNTYSGSIVYGKSFLQCKCSTHHTALYKDHSVFIQGCGPIPHDIVYSNNSSFSHFLVPFQLCCLIYSGFYRGTAFPVWILLYYIRSMVKYSSSVKPFKHSHAWPKPALHNWHHLR